MLRVERCKTNGVNFCRWLTEPASECSAVCGAGEMSQRSICIQLLSNGHQQRVDDVYCRDSEKPPDRVPCFNDCAGRKWVYTEWDTVSFTSGAEIIILYLQQFALVISFS